MTTEDGTVARAKRDPIPAWAALLGAVLVLGSVVGFYTLRGDSTEAGEQLGVLEQKRPAVGERAPDFALRDVRDPAKVVRLSDYRGKVVVLNWYATWCGPCRYEIPDFESVYKEREAEMVVLAVNLRESAAEASGMLDELGATFPAVLDSEGRVAEHYRVTGMPTTFLIDRDGVIRRAGSGLVTRDALLAGLAEVGVN